MPDQTSIQVLQLYIPSKDEEGNEVADQKKWVMEAAAILARIGGGVTIMPPVEGGWVKESGDILWEETIVVYTYVKVDEFLTQLARLREFVHRFGRETGQGEVVVEFDGRFYRVVRIDPDGES